MMLVTSDVLVRELALGLPGAVRVFQKHHIDFCCGGKIPLAEACAATGANLEAVLRELNAEGERSAAPDVRWESRPISELVQHILDQHHVFTRTSLTTLQPLVEKVRRVHGERHPELVEMAKLFTALRDDLDPHLVKEERILFPAILEESERGPHSGCFGAISNPIGMMLIEHDGVGEILRALRRTTGDFVPPDDACTTYRATYAELEALETDLHLHIHLENNVLFPRVLANHQSESVT
jgi:regulator of cell morphogenesis and NO signaling